MPYPKFTVRKPFKKHEEPPESFWEFDREYHSTHAKYYAESKSLYEEYIQKNPQPKLDSSSYEELNAWYKKFDKYQAERNKMPKPDYETWSKARREYYLDITVSQYNSNMVRLNRPTIVGYLVYSPVYRQRAYDRSFDDVPNPIETVTSRFEFMAAKMSDGSVIQYFIWRGLMKRQGNKTNPLPKYWSNIVEIVNQESEKEA